MDELKKEFEELMLTDYGFDTNKVIWEWVRNNFTPISNYPVLKWQLEGRVAEREGIASVFNETDKEDMDKFSFWLNAGRKINLETEMEKTP